MTPQGTLISSVQNPLNRLSSYRHNPFTPILFLFINFRQTKITLSEILLIFLLSHLPLFFSIFSLSLIITFKDLFWFPFSWSCVYLLIKNTSSFCSPLSAHSCINHRLDTSVKNGFLKQFRSSVFWLTHPLSPYYNKSPFNLLTKPVCWDHLINHDKFRVKSNHWYLKIATSTR